jgi:transaldolase
MRFFLNSASLEDARKAREWGVLDGVCLSPGIIREPGRDYRAVIREMASICDGPVMVAVRSSDAKGMYKEAREYHKLGKDIVVQIPMSVDVMKVLRLLSEDQIAANVSHCFSAAQALIAAKGGAAYVSPSVGQLDQVGHIGMDLVEEVIRIYDNYGFQTHILVEDVRNPIHLLDAALMGADVAAMPFAVMEELFRHPLTDLALERFSGRAGEAERRGP